MKLTRGILFIVSALLCAASIAGIAAERTASKIRVLVITGGHDFEHDQFFRLFRDNPEITFEAVEHPNAHAQLRPEAAKNYDVLVTYDMHQEISEEAKADLLSWLNHGKGLVVLHHAIASYQNWPEYSRIIGAHYYLEKTQVNGVEKARSVYQHGVHFTIHAADPNHPVTRGIKDFEINDETYNLFDVDPGVHSLLTTEEHLSNKIIGWSKSYGPARVVYLQSGHDHFAYENPHYQQILKQAIRWAARKD